MGLLDGVLGNVLGSLLGGGSAPGANTQGAGQGTGQSRITPFLVKLALQLLQQSGGLQGVLDKLRKAGLTKQADSWVSTGSNEPVAAEQISQALGPDLLQQLGSQTGMDGNQISQALAQVLPELVNQMTPEGRLPDNDDQIVRDGLQALQKEGLA